MLKLVIGCWIFVIGYCIDASAQSTIQKIDNKDKSFTLIKNDTINESSIPVLKYKVIRNADKRMVVDAAVTMGIIEWTADYELTESKSLGTGQSAPKQTKKIDLRPYLIKP